jgi:1,4-alpha-glucan branching enzyme
MVFNHSDMDAPLTKIDFYYWYRQARKGELSFGPKLDYERYDPNLRIFPARDFSLKVARHWITEYKIDGFRLDTTRVLDNFDFLWALRGVAQQAARGKPFYLVAEHLGEDPAMANHGPADGAWHHGFMQEVLAHIKDKPYDPNALLAHLQLHYQGYTQPELVCHYLETHDELPLMRQLGQAKIFGAEALKRHKLAATLLFTAVGNPMLHQGQEFGEYRPKSLKIRRLNWKLETASYGQALKAHYKHLAWLRHGSSGLMGSDFRISFVDANTGIVAFARGYGQAEVMVLVNLQNQAQPLHMPFPNGVWHERLFGYQVEVANGVLNDWLEPFAAKIFTRR